MNTRCFTVLATLALLGFSATAAAHPCERHEDKSDKHCNQGGGGGGGGDDSATYRAELTMGGFIFDARDVTPNSRGVAFNGDGSSFTVNRGAGTASEMAWQDVLANCADLLLAANNIDYMTVSSFDANPKWNIGGDGIDIWMNFGVTDFGVPGLHIGISLGGVVGTEPVVPACGSPQRFFTLTRYTINGQAKRGLKGPSCQNFDGQFDGHLQAYSELKIERTDC